MARKILRPSKRTNGLIRDAELRQQKREAVADAAFDLFLKGGFIARPPARSPGGRASNSTSKS
jgi:hypothetical protein